LREAGVRVMRKPRRIISLADNRIAVVTPAVNGGRFTSYIPPLEVRFGLNSRYP
jgi:hypothetical protein